MKRILTLCLAAALVLALGTAAFASADPWGEYTMTNDGYGYLTANFPAVYPAAQVISEGTQVVSDKTDAILLTVTEAELREIAAAFASEPVAWDGIARMGIPAVTEGEPVSAAEVFTRFDAEAIAEALAERAQLARADGFNALRLVGLESFPETLAEAAEALFAETMSDSGVVALPGSGGASDEPADAQVRELLTAMGAAGYLQYMQVSRDGLAALDMTPPPSIEVEAAAYEKPVEPGDTAILLPENAKAGESFEIVAVTAPEAMSAMLRDENGENLPIDDMLKENLGDSLRFTFTVTFDAPVTMPIYLYTMTTSGWGAEPEASAELTVR